MELPVAEVVTSSVRTAAEHLLVKVGELVPAIAAAITVLVISWALATLVRRGVRYAVRFVNNPMQRSLIRHVSYYTVWALGIVVALDVLGVDAKAVVTGLGLGGVALGFALKDILSNLVSGLLILVTDSFKIGDQIVVGATEGTVERIEIRATHIRTYDGRLVLVPNGDVFTSRVTNNTASPLRRASVFVYLDYRQDLERALTIILETVSRVPGVSAEPAASMRLHDLTPQYLHVEARIWTDSRRTNFMNTASSARIAMVNALTKEGVALPHPDDRHVTLMKPHSGAPWVQGDQQLPEKDADKLLPPTP